MCYKDLFDKINKFHILIRIGHGVNVKLRNALHISYNVPRPAIEISLTDVICVMCNCKKPINGKLVIKSQLQISTKEHK